MKEIEPLLTSLPAWAIILLACLVLLPQVLARTVVAIRQLSPIRRLHERRMGQLEVLKTALEIRSYAAEKKVELSDYEKELLTVKGLSSEATDSAPNQPVNSDQIEALWKQCLAGAVGASLIPLLRIFTNATEWNLVLNFGFVLGILVQCVTGAVLVYLYRPGTMRNSLFVGIAFVAILSILVKSPQAAEPQTNTRPSISQIG